MVDLLLPSIPPQWTYHFRQYHHIRDLNNSNLSLELKRVNFLDFHSPNFGILCE